MKNKELQALVNKTVAVYEDDYLYIGVRFEDKARTVGEAVEDYSKSNIDREDEREFPEYGTEEYAEMEELNGVSAWSVAMKFDNGRNSDKNAKTYTDHCYVLGSKKASIGLDNDEIVMENAVVLAVAF